MTINEWLIVGAFIALLALYTFEIIRGKPSRKYHLKSLAHSLWHILGLVVVLYSTVFYIEVLQYLFDIHAKVVVKANIQPTWINQGYLLFLTFGGIVGLVLLATRWYKYVPFKFTDEEKQWKKESDDKFNQKFRKLFGMKPKSITK